MVKRINFEGRTFEFPDDASDQEISRALQQEPAPAARPRQVGQGEDIARSATSGLHRGGAQVFGILGDVQDLSAQASGVGLYWTLRARGRSDAQARDEVQAFLDDGRADRQNLGIQLPTSQSVEDAFVAIEPEAARDWTTHEPQTVAGEYTRSVRQMVPNALLPGSGPVRAMRVIAPAVTSEAAGQVAREVAPQYEGAARVVGALGSGLAVESQVGSVAAAARPRPQTQGPAPDPDEFFPRTQGERTGDIAARQRENELRRTRHTDAGGSTHQVPEQAQRTMRDFDDARAEVLQDNLIRRIATRGRDPTTESVGDAGVVVADDLRSGREAMRAEQGRRYARAMKLAENTRVAPTDELASNVASVVDREFLNVPEAHFVIGRLQAQIQSGKATYGSVERARQQLNRLLGASMRAGDDAQTYALHRVIDEVDAFVEPRLAGDAQTAIREARGYTREMMSTYGEQARPELSTGHTGRADPGGRTLGTILDTDMTGEQVVDAIFGVGGRPPRSALAVVQRIRDRATQRISTSGYQAPTAQTGQQQRVAGRESLRGGRATSGGRQFDPTPQQRDRFGNEAISDPALQALREAFIYRLSRRLAARGQGDALPAQQMANDLRAALDGSGKEITGLLFNGEEHALMRRALADLETAAVPRSTYNPSAPGVAQAAAERSFAAIAGRIIGKVPMIGPPIGEAIEQGIVNARAIRDARRAVTQPSAVVSPPRPPPPPPAGPQPYAPYGAAALADRDPNNHRR